MKGDSMQRYFVQGKNGDSFILSSGDLHHIKDVMRYDVNDLIEIVYNKIIYKCKITNLLPFSLEIIDECNQDSELKVNLVVAVSLVSEQKFDLILQKLTELGVNRIIPIMTDRSIVKLDEEKVSKKLDRWRKICKEASEQSHRIIIPSVDNILDIKDIVKVKSDLKLVCSLGENVKQLNDCLDSSYSDILFVIGPEGGLSSKEEKYLLDNGFTGVSLGKRVLRVETAAIYVASIISYVYGG